MCVGGHAGKKFNENTGSLVCFGDLLLRNNEI
jgi:hypothetical protein